VAEPTTTPKRGPTVRPGALFAVLSLVALLVGYAIGRVSTPAPAPAALAPSVAVTGDGHGHDHGAPAADTPVGGLAATGSGLTLVVDSPAVTAGVAQRLAFRIVGRDGAPVRRFEVVHDKRLHLIVVRADLTGYQHLHPDLAPDGTWTVPITLPTAGVWRMYTDFTTVTGTGRPLGVTLAGNLTVAGAFAPVALPAPADTATVDGYTVTIEGSLQVGASTPLLVRVSRDGQPVTALDRYLGAFGHLVVLRAADLAYLHVHPEEQLVGGAVKFWLAASGPGRYRAFFDFSIGGTARTAEFTVQVG
jgi:hypothetical protein